MPSDLADAVKVALDLSVHHRVALANFLLESAEPDPAIEAVWDEEIRARLRAVEEGRAVGIPLAEVMRQAEEILSRAN